MFKEWPDASLHRANVGRLLALGALDDIERNFLIGSEGLQLGIVERERKVRAAAVGRDEANPLSVVIPLHSAGTHACVFLSDSRISDPTRVG